MKETITCPKCKGSGHIEVDMPAKPKCAKCGQEFQFCDKVKFVSAIEGYHEYCYASVSQLAEEAALNPAQ